MPGKQHKKGNTSTGFSKDEQELARQMEEKE